MRAGQAVRGAALVVRLAPLVVAVGETFHDRPLSLFPEEAVVARSVEKRQREFTTVRHCAREALADLGRTPAASRAGRRGSWAA